MLEIMNAAPLTLSPFKDLTTGSTFAGRYQIIGELGKGGMGWVYKGFDTDIKEKVALKLVKLAKPTTRDGLERLSLRYGC
jgi:hypothetical protein